MKYNPPTNTMRKIFSNVMGRLNALLKRFNRYDAEVASVVSDATKGSRAQVLRQALNDLFCLGYHLQKITNFGDRHVRVLARHWEKQCLSASTIQWRFSCLRTFEKWIGKPGLVRDPRYYLDNPSAAKRTYKLKPGEEKTWTAMNVDVQAKILEIAQDDLNVALQLLASWAFVLRPRESWTLRPELADRGHTLMVNWGTKGGRDRVVPIDTEGQRAVLDLLKQYADPTTGSLIPKRYSLQGWKDHFYEVCRRHGISRKSGIVPHGLRHESANALFTELCGEIRSQNPIKETANILSDAEKREDLARRVVSEYLGHSRTQITGCYLPPREERKDEEEVVSESAVLVEEDEE